MIDICDFAVGLSRQLYGLTIATERPGHRMMETWHPLGRGRRDLGLQLPGRGLGVERLPRLGLRRQRGVEAVREDADLPPPRSPLCSRRAAERFGDAPAGLLEVVQGGRETGEALVDDPRVAAGLGDRLDPDGPRAWGRASPRASAAPCSSSAATMR